MAMRFSLEPREKFAPTSRWEHFDFKRTLEAEGDYLLLYEHFTRLTYDRGMTPREIIERAAHSSDGAIAIDLLDKCLSVPVHKRGGAFFGWTGDIIDECVSHYPGRRWWLSKHGLVIAKVEPEDLPIGAFDRLAGELWFENSKNGRLSYARLVKIAEKLDAAEFPLRQNLEPTQWIVFSAEAKKTKKPAPKTFSEAVNSSKHAKRIRAIRLRLSRAKQRYEKSIYRPKEREQVGEVSQNLV